MQCPFLKNISFKKISQVPSDDDCLPEPTCESLPSLDALSDEDCNCPEENIDSINASPMHQHRLYHLNSMQAHNSLPAPLTIAYPKPSPSPLALPPTQEEPTLEQLSSSEDEYDKENEPGNLEAGSILSGEDEISSEGGPQKNVPHVLVSKMGTLSDHHEQIFQGQAYLNHEPHQCRLANQQLHLTRHHKTVCFVDMNIYPTEAKQDSAHSRTVTFTAHTNPYHTTLVLTFKSTSKVKAFLRAHSLNQPIELPFTPPHSLDSLGLATERMDMAELAKCGDTLDIIMYKNKSFMSQCQRLLTNSHYDHVGLLLKSYSQQLFILESTSNAGVAIYALKSLIQLPRQQYFLRLGLRRYKGERSYALLATLEQFVRKSLGKKYKFDPMYLLSDQVNKSDDTYFCSQLVAAALQRVDVLRKNRPAYKYLPKHISDDSFNEEIVQGHYSDVIVLE